MFKKKQKKRAELPPERDPESPETSGQEIDDRGVDVLAQVLRTFGEFSFDTAETEREAAQESFETWARHLLLGVAPPGITSMAEGVRDWPGLVRFTSEHRREESEYVVRSLADLRSALWLFIQGISRAIPDDQARDDAIGAELKRVRDCLESSDTGEIRRTVIASTSAMETVIAESSERSRKQIAELSAEIDRFSNELVEARQQLERDSLTSLYNRGAFDEVLERMVHLSRLSASRSTLFLIDVDDFKWVNDHFGHPAGDEVLKEVSRCLGACFSRRGDFVARYGGDEFAVMVQTDSEQADMELGENAILRVRDLEVPSGDERIRVTLSVGAARCEPGEEAADWLSRADQALYHAKRSGRDRFASFSECAKAASE